MNYYEDVYRKRLNRYGLDYQSRIQGQREREFENYLLKSIYRIDFEYDNILQAGSLERNKQDYMQTQAYLLTKRDLIIPNGTILMVHNQDGSIDPWMVWWLENIEASGYNRYIVLQMTHEISWIVDGITHTQWAYFAGTGTATINDMLKTASTTARYTENNNLSMIITPYQSTLQPTVYFKITDLEQSTAYIIKEIDIHSTVGVEYVSIDPTYPRDTMTTAASSNHQEITWLNGGHA